MRALHIVMTLLQVHHFGLVCSFPSNMRAARALHVGHARRLQL